MMEVNKNKIEINLAAGLEYKVKGSGEIAIVSVSLIKTPKKQRVITYNDKGLNKILKEAERIHMKGDPNVRLNSEWFEIIKRLVKQSRL